MDKDIQEKTTEIIETVDEIIEQKEPASEAPESNDNQKQPKSNKRVLIVSLLIAATIILSFLSIYFVINTAVKSGTTTLMDSYTDSFKDSVAEIRQTVQNAAAEFTETVYHIENYVTINIGALQECSNLEVLKIRESDVNIVNGKSEFDTTSWLEVIETCEYVIDLTSAEFIIDNARSTVTVRLPDPEVRNFTVEKYNERFDHSSFLTSDKKAGDELIAKQIKEADANIRTKVLANQDYYNTAKESAVNMVTNAIRVLNTDIEDLQIIVEYLND